MVSKITLVTADNKSHQIDRDVALRSLLLKNMLEDLEHMEEEEDGDGGPRIPLPNVEGKVLEKVEYLFLIISFIRILTLTNTLIL